MNKNLILSVLFIGFSFNGATFSMDSEKDQDKRAEKVFIGKVSNTKPLKKINNGWYDAELITLHAHVYLKDNSGYDSQSKSHQLLKTSTHSSSTSAATSTLTLRKNEKKQTHIKYDKNSIQQDGKDFMVDATRVNCKNQPTGKINYHVGHLVDHKFNVQDSHPDNSNYVPQHHHYIRWLKKYIVKSASDYLEIPIFTPNPPLIKIMKENRYDSIPIGILLVPLENLKIQTMYYFPNNQYNYRTCQNNLKIKKDITKKMISLFKLDKVFHDFIWPAIVHNICEKGNELASQIIQENKGTHNVGKLVEGMSIPDLNDEEAVLATLTSNVIHQSDVDLSKILSVSKERLKAMKLGQSNQVALQQSFNVLGHFLIDYALRNALKSEILSTHSRIMFANIVTDFIECQDQVSEKTLKRVDEFYGNLYPATLKKLSKIKEDMNLRDLIYYANLYQRLSTPFIEAPLFELTGFQICKNLNIVNNMITFTDILRTVYKKTENEKLNAEQMQNLVDLFLDAQVSISYHICNGCPSEELKDQISFLKKAKKRVLKWNSLTNDTNGTYQTSPNSASSFRAMPGYKAKQIEYLGTTSSACYQNDNEDSEHDEKRSG